MAEWLTSHAVTAAAMEGTGVYWRAPLDRLEAAGIEVQLLHAHHVKQLRGRKTDVEDSRWLARVCQFGLCRPSLVPNQEFHGLRRMSRYRRQLVQKRSQTRNRIQKEIDDAGVRIGGILSDVFGKNGRIILEGLARGEDRETILSRLTPHVAEKIKLLGEALTLKLSCSGRMILNHLMTDERAEQARIAAVEADLIRAFRPYASQLILLQTLPGIDRIGAAAILAEIGGPDVTPFASAEAFTAWAGLAPGNHESAGKRRKATTLKGSRYLRTLLVEAAHGAARTKNCQFASYRKVLTARRGYKRAIVATAHKMARALYAMLRDDVPYRDPDIDYEALLVDRNAPRWLRQLKECGVLKPVGDHTFRIDWSARTARPKPA